jgi:hypothetical protein
MADPGCLLHVGWRGCRSVLGILYPKGLAPSSGAEGSPLNQGEMLHCAPLHCVPWCSVQHDVVPCGLPVSVIQRWDAGRGGRGRNRSHVGEALQIHFVGAHGAGATPAVLHPWSSLLKREFCLALSIHLNPAVDQILSHVSKVGQAFVDKCPVNEIPAVHRRPVSCREHRVLVLEDLLPESSSDQMSIFQGRPQSP